MRAFCAVRTCENRKSLTKENPAIVYHQFPKDQDRCAKWITFCDRGENWRPKESQAICSEHFAESCYDNRYHRRRQLFPNGRFQYNMPVSCKIQEWRFQLSAIPGPVNRTITGSSVLSTGRPLSNSLSECNLNRTLFRYQLPEQPPNYTGDVSTSISHSLPTSIQQPTVSTSSSTPCQQSFSPVPSSYQPLLPNSSGTVSSLPRKTLSTPSQQSSVSVRHSTPCQKSITGAFGEVFFY